METPKNVEPGGKQPTRNNRMARLEESSIFAPRPSSPASGRFVEEKRAAKGQAGRTWIFIAALVLVLSVVFFLSKRTGGLAAQDSRQLSGFAGGAVDAATSTSTDVPTPTQILIPTVTFTPTMSIGASRARPSDGMLMMYVPSGPFTMGAAVDAAMVECAKTRVDCESAWFVDESPPHLVNLDAYWMDQIEVTNAMYALCVNAGMCKPPEITESDTVHDYYGNPAYADYPVIYMTWKQANTYCQWAGARLPTEAEWEKAARGTDERLYPWGGAAPDCSLSNINPFNGDTCSGDVGAAKNYPNGQSPYQIFNLAGNVAEWVGDWYDPGYYASSPSNNPQGPQAGITKIMRGGSWYTDEAYASSTYRYKQDARYYYSFTGFRCVVSE